MADQILRDKKGFRFGKISTDARGNATIYDKMNIRLGTIKVDSSGNQIAYDKMNRRLATYDVRTDVTRDPMNRRIGKGNLLIGFYFENRG